MPLTIEQFAKKCGVTLHPCDAAFGGKIAYKSADHPNITIAGFRTEAAAYRRWLEDTFGKTAGRVVLKLLKEQTE